jgi:hypothetical protein
VPGPPCRCIFASRPQVGQANSTLIGSFRKRVLDSHEHIRVFGENTFGLEDLRADQHSDFDYNDMLVHITTA